MEDLDRFGGTPISGNLQMMMIFPLDHFGLKWDVLMGTTGTIISNMGIMIWGCNDIFFFHGT